MAYHNSVGLLWLAELYNFEENNILNWAVFIHQETVHQILPLYYTYILKGYYTQG